MFGSLCGGFDNHGRNHSKELDYDRDHNREQDGFHGVVGRSDLFDDFSLITVLFMLINRFN